MKHRCSFFADRGEVLFGDPEIRLCDVALNEREILERVPVFAAISSSSAEARSTNGVLDK
jgi:hypothetical protein